MLGRPAFYRRAGRHVAVAALIALAIDGAGTLGYRVFAHLGWIDAFLNASMILGGMGPVDRMETSSAKIFAAVYALFSGLVFIALSGIVLAPWAHRLFHWFHIDEKEP
jgi:hypothetical protein